CGRTSFEGWDLWMGQQGGMIGFVVKAVLPVGVLEVVPFSSSS
ncbi:hypothetical protein A2U01_0098919, partial [Trifolium medium]|nr:hypothetical protein [Trifolium medium]